MGKHPHRKGRVWKSLFGKKRITDILSVNSQRWVEISKCETKANKNRFFHNDRLLNWLDLAGEWTVSREFFSSWGLLLTMLSDDRWKKNFSRFVDPCPFCLPSFLLPFEGREEGVWKQTPVLTAPDESGERWTRLEDISGTKFCPETNFLLSRIIYLAFSRQLFFNKRIIFSSEKCVDGSGKE